jgi:hypothetical protein
MAPGLKCLTDLGQVLNFSNLAETGPCRQSGLELGQIRKTQHLTPSHSACRGSRTQIDPQHAERFRLSLQRWMAPLVFSVSLKLDSSRLIVDAQTVSIQQHGPQQRILTIVRDDLRFAFRKSSRTNQTNKQTSPVRPNGHRPKSLLRTTAALIPMLRFVSVVTPMFH